MPAIKIDSDRLVEAVRLRVKFKDIFNLKEFYRAMHEWFLEYEWKSADAEGNIENADHCESLYLERIGAKGDKEMYWYWRLQKVPSDNSYYKYHLDVNSHPLYILPAEVMRDGKKFKAHKGEVEVKIYAYIEFDYKGQWSNHPFLKFFNSIFPRRIFRWEIYEDHKKELYREVYIFQDYIKKWFKLKSFLPYEEITPFYPSAAYPEWKKE